MDGTLQVGERYIGVPEKFPELEEPLFVKNRQALGEHEVASKGNGDVSLFRFVKHFAPPFKTEMPI